MIASTPSPVRWRIPFDSRTLLLLLALAPPSLLAQDKSGWVGKRVVTKTGAVLRIDEKTVDHQGLENRRQGGKRSEARIYTIKKVDGTLLWLNEEGGGARGWVQASDVVEYDRALDYFSEEIRANPANVFAYVRRGHLWRDKKEYDLAIADFNAAIRIDPKSEVAWAGRGNVWSDKAAYEKAISDYDQAIRIDPNYSTAYANRGIAWYRKKKTDLAIADFSEAVRINPNDAASYNNRGIAWRDKKDHNKAIADYTEAIRIDPNYAWAYNNRGIAWRAKQNDDQAIADYSEAIRIDPDHTEAYWNRGFVWLAKKEYDKAIADYNEAIRLKPKKAKAYFNRGFAWDQKGEFDKAIADYSVAIRIDPEDAEAYNNRGGAWDQKQEYEKAIADYSEAIRLDPDHAMTYFNRSGVQMILGRAEALNGFKAVIELRGWRWGMSGYSAILGHFAASRAGKEVEAKAFVDAAAANCDPAEWPYPVVKFLKGDLDEAGVLALANDRDKMTELRCYLGLEYALRGRKDEAMAHLRWVKDHGTKSFYEYRISSKELDRLEKSPTPPAEPNRP